MTTSSPIVLSAGGGPSGFAYRRAAFLRQLIYASLLGGASLLFGLWLGLSLESPYTFLVFALLATVAVPVWHRPIVGVYVLVAGAAALESFYLGFPDSFTDQLFFFKSFRSMKEPLPLPGSPAELLMVLTLAAVVRRRLAAHQKPLEVGPLFGVIGLFTLMGLFGIVYGIGTGGNLQQSAWEFRPQVYMLITYLLAVNLVRDRSQLNRILWIFLIGLVFKSFVGLWRYAITLGGDLDKIREFTTENSVLAHEESFFFALFLIFALLLYLFRAHRAQLMFTLIFALPVILAFLLNERRAGFVVLAVGLIVVGFMAYALLQRMRRPLLILLLIALVCLPPYVVALGKSNNLVAQPARSVMSMIQPGERDASSNDYRQLEGENLKWNISASPVLGTGYGHSIEFFENLSVHTISGSFAFLDLIPHNTVLWVWMRLGYLGFVIFWFMIGRIIIEGAMVARKLEDPYLRVISIFAVVSLIGWVFQGAMDMGLVDFRANILIGVLVGMICRLPGLDRVQPAQVDRKSLPV